MSKQFLLIISVAIVFLLGVFFFLLNYQKPVPLSAPTETVIDTDIHKPPPSPNPTYIEKVRREPFWEKLPYFSQNYKIEYRDSSDTVIVTTFLPASKTEIYKEEAILWLRSNGAKVDALKIEYVRGVKDY